MERRERMFPRIESDGKNLTVRKDSIRSRKKDMTLSGGRECNISKMMPTLRDIQGEQCSETFRTRLPKTKRKSSFNKVFDSDVKLNFPDISERRRSYRPVDMRPRKSNFKETKKSQKFLGILPEI